MFKLIITMFYADGSKRAVGPDFTFDTIQECYFELAYQGGLVLSKMYEIAPFDAFSAVCVLQAGAV